MKINLKNSLLLFFVLLSIQSYSEVVYVNANIIGGNNNGISWEDSYSNFQSAIVAAVYGDTIWVAQGTYFPTSDTNQDISFELKNGVKWFGGFQGNETTLGQRDYELYPTILSGDIGVQGDSTDNSYHVIYTISSDTTTILNGFIVEDGRAIDPVTTTGSPRNFG
ncbi:MAG: autotransporter family porin, partial [Polaribacter sp.]